MALQPDRSLDSVVPLGVTDRVKAFAIGGRPKLPKLTGQRTHLTLGYDATDPGQLDVARLLRDRLEELGGVSVRVTASDKADLLLTTDPAWINNSLGWLQLYLSAPLGSSKAKLAALESHARAATGTPRAADLSELQQQAATDNTVLPVSQGNGLLLVGRGVKLAAGDFGSGQQLGLWGFSRG
jgi:peptide/nickel transport system substrate-binding protein